MSKTALIFPGQGAQAVGMGKDIAAAYPESKELFERAGKVLGFDIAQLCFEGPEDKLSQADNVQPAIFTVSVACLAALKKECPSLDVACTAGLSLGEWAALYYAGVLSFEDCVRILAARGKFMMEACNQNPGGMLSVMNLDLAALKKISEEAGVEIANLNSPVQTVLSGKMEGIDKAEALAKAAGAKRALKLNVAGAFHSSLMSPAAEKLAAVLKDVQFAAPTVPVVANVTAQPHGSPEDTRAAMVRQVNSSVRWVESVEWMKGQGITRYIECGPGKVLTGLVSRIDSAAAGLNVFDVPSLQRTAEALKA